MTETRCGDIIGCFTGTFLTAHAYEQSVTARLCAIYHPWPSSSWSPAIAVGGGPTAVHVDVDDDIVRRDGLAIDVRLGVERGRGVRWTASIGVRATPIGSVAEGRVDHVGWYVRAGLAFGG